jgi:hypothetical protein
MSEYLFGVGSGQISDREAKRVEKIASKHGATFVRWCGPECLCGRNCGGCNYRFWFAGPNRGKPFDEWMADDVLAEVGEIKRKR